ncbi:hypothetical protein Salat_0077300 [Sesamum alatum]|uniref:Uncharacterized protein n=1 Tax=Sesamum alatum TaxID=300844 RepID=A0AAE2CX86_9LAMI|nr:hypothetical protein Salat_0077300 [Sesamum alatum]
MRESDVMDKLKLAEEQLEQQSQVLEKVTARSAELESSYESLTRDSDLKLQEAIASFTNRDSEAKVLHEKVEALELQVKAYQVQLAEATERYETANKELDQILEKLASSESINDDLKRKILEVEGTADSYLSENALLSEHNARLNDKVKDLEEKLTTTVSEMETSAKQLASHMNTITELTEHHSKVSELHLAAEARVSEAEAKLEEALQKYSLRDSEARDLNDKLTAIDAQVKTYEEQAQLASALVKSRELELEQILSKSRDLTDELERNSGQSKKEIEALVEVNSQLTQDLASCKSALSELQTKLSSISSEKDGAVDELNTARNEIEELKQRLDSEGQKLQSQMSSVMEENNLLNETFHSSKKDLQTIIENLEEQLKEQKSNEDALKAKLEILNAEVGQKDELQNHLKELEKQLATAEAQLKEEKEVSSQKDLEQEAALKHSFEELDAKKKEVIVLENQVKDLEQRLQLADAKSKEKDIGAATSEQKEETIKSREIDSFSSTPSKRKSKKKLESASAPALSSDTQKHTTEASPAMNLKFILGVAIVSVIVGIILGKRY